jgi:hypothetical protein
MHTFNQLHEICRVSQLNQMKKTVLDAGFEGVSVIAEAGVSKTPGTKFTHDSVGLIQADAVVKSGLLNRLASLDICNFHRTQGIGFQYIRDSKSGSFSPLVDTEGADMESGMDRSTRQCRSFLTANCYSDIASCNVQRGDLLCSF